MSGSSFLGAVKNELREQFAAVYDALAEIVTDEDQLAAALKVANKKAWKLFEAKLKESFKNGQHAGGTKPADHVVPRKNPFRE